ncbi:uncharacterized protein zp3c [Chanos chanos]|uniref:Uncharacterized protein zp3c n=1 Tax=Chanos chanos TaxID=29144 RepID=A0A6J2VRV6_CHACN|nr:uncharacterized protein LOC115815961 [Chanos chanos]
MSLRISLILLFVSYVAGLSPFESDDFPFEEELEDLEGLAWTEVEDKNIDGDNETSVPAYKSAEFKHYLPVLKLPESLRIPASLVQKGLFRPEPGTQPVPSAVKRILLPLRITSVKPNVDKRVEVLCHLDRIYVRVLRSMFSNRLAWKYLKFGSCPVNQATSKHYYFLHYLKGCSLQRQESADRVIFSNTVYYRPPAPKGPVARELPFSVAVQCRYNKFFRSYKIGFFPRLQGGTVHKILNSDSTIRLSAYDASWKPLQHGHGYSIGQPMYFEVKTGAPRHGGKIYVNNCHISASQHPESTDKYPVVEKAGCMVDSKASSASKFISHTETSVKFSVGAFVPKEMIGQARKVLYLHCEVTVGPAEPSFAYKSCTFDWNTRTCPGDMKG